MCPFALLAAWRTFEGDLPEQPVRRTQWRDGKLGSWVYLLTPSEQGAKELP